MNVEEIAKQIEEFWGVNSICCPFGSCTEDFANKKMLEMAKHNFPSKIVEIIEENPIEYPKYKHFDNGRWIGVYFANVIRNHCKTLGVESIW